MPGDAKNTRRRGTSVRRSACFCLSAAGARFLVAMACLLSFGFPSSGRAQQPVPGQRRMADVHAVVNFQELAAREAAAPPAALPRRVVPFQPIPGDLPVPPDLPLPQGSELPAAEPELPMALQPSPSPADGFEALGDNNTSIPPDTMGTVGLNYLTGRGRNCFFQAAFSS